MNNQRKFLLGAAAGTAAMLAGRRVARQRHAIVFHGRTVVISGGSRGLGLVMARQFAAQGARVKMLARDPDELHRALAQVVHRSDADAADGVSVVECDVRSATSVRRAVAAVLGEHAGIDVLVNNAGVIQVGPLEHMTTSDFENAMETHFWGPLRLMQECVPSMRRRGFGRIVNVASVGGRVAVPHLAAYCASKFALVGLSDAVRAELAQHGIRVTTVSPGLMRTGSPVNAQMKGQHEAEFTWFALAAALPGLSVSAESAARQVIEACRHGDPELTIGAPARAATVANALFPGTVAHLMTLATRLLPGPGGADGDLSKPGREAQTEWAPSVLTAPGDSAAVVNNEL